MSFMSMRKTYARFKWLSPLALVLIICLLSGVVACTSDDGHAGNPASSTAPDSSLQQTAETPDDPAAPSTKMQEKTESTQADAFHEIGFVPDPDTTIAIQLLEDEVNLNPLQEGNGFPVDSLSGCDLVYETLLKWDPEELTYKPGLAELLGIYADGIKLKIREDAVWHDGRPVTPEQIELSLYWMCKFTEGCREAEGLITKVETETDGELATDRIFLTLAENGKYYQALALDLLCRAPIMPANIWCEGRDPLTITEEELQIQADKQPLGTGPWQVKLNDSFQLVLERCVAVDNKPQYLMLRKYKDRLSKERAFANQEIDILGGTLPDDGNSSDYFTGKPLLSGIVVKQDHYLFKNIYYRNLLQLAVDTSKTGHILDSKAATTIFWHYFGGATLVSRLRPDLSKPVFAETYLANKWEIATRLGGTWDSDGVLHLEQQPLATLDLILPADPQVEAACRAFAQSALRQGLRLELVILDQETYGQRIDNHDYDLCYIQTTERLETPYSLAQDFLYHLDRDDFEELVTSGLSQQVRTLALALASAGTTDDFVAAAKDCYQYSLQQMQFFPLGCRTINNGYFNSKYRQNISDYWATHLDKRDLTGNSASEILDSITAD